METSWRSRASWDRPGKEIPFWKSATQCFHFHWCSVATWSKWWHSPESTELCQWHRPYQHQRRETPGLPVTSQELQDLRSLIGSIQYAGTNTRPDLSCRLSLLQARVTCATVAGLTQRNKVAEWCKAILWNRNQNPSSSSWSSKVFSFSDAAFATREKANSQKGCLILATTEEIYKTQMSSVSPLVWLS